MQVFDFDKTLYPHDSASRFYLYCLKRRPQIALLLPWQAVLGLLFLLRLMSREGFKARFFAFLRLVPDPRGYARAFWTEEAEKLFPWYETLHRSDDVLISASPRFLLEPIAERLGVGTLLATEMNPCSGRIAGRNCYGAEKPRRFYAAFPEGPRIESFYSDSLSDTPMALLAEKSFLVKKDGSLAPWPKR